MPRKKRPEGTRAPNGASSIYYSEYDQKWHGRVTMGIKDNGQPDRPHVKRATEAEVIEAVRALEKQRDAGTVRKTGQRWTVERWLVFWVENIAAPSVRPGTMTGYRTSVYKHLTPGIGAHRLEKLTPEHLEALYSRMTATKVYKPATIHLVHRTVRVALNEAKRRKYITENPASLAKPPKVEEEEIEPFTDGEVLKIVTTAAKPNRRRQRARWTVSLATGLRRGEALGLRWPDITITWRHGCSPKAPCGKRAAKTCPERRGRGRMKIRYALHQRRWEHGCDGACGASPAAKCPSRHSGGLVLAPVKSRAGRRVIGLPHQLCVELEEHREIQEHERHAAGQLWQGLDLVFTNLTGGPIHFSEDFRAWKALLGDAGVRDARLHDARHTAATMLLILGVPLPVVMKLMGWSNAAVAARYLHVVDEILDSVADQVGDRMWNLNDDTEDDDDEGDLAQVISL
ncbi:tyrosine-type recombinase/integrase [Actinokineospora globicatena]|uniref:Site-specific integrase n=1 Tax=Actinokineospora globicatena TaxID=103729 RepID=A0A9W6QKU5_9PSEU|nr:site-specific integrase [Actinokineospora globicatena]GLW91886.1 site-specific integrase [Actinokineospora globicatena]